MICFNMSQYMLELRVPSMNRSSPVPAALMQPQTMTLPPPCLTVGKTHVSLYSSPGCHHTHFPDSKNNLGQIWPRPIGSSGPDPHNRLGPVTFGTTGQYRQGSVFPYLDQKWASSRPDADSFMGIWTKCGPDLA